MEHKAFQVGDRSEPVHRALWLETELSPACRLPTGDGKAAGEPLLKWQQLDGATMVCDAD